MSKSFIDSIVYSKKLQMATAYIFEVMFQQTNANRCALKH